MPSTSRSYHNRRNPTVGIDPSQFYDCLSFLRSFESLTTFSAWDYILVLCLWLLYRVPWWTCNNPHVSVFNSISCHTTTFFPYFHDWYRLIDNHGFFFVGFFIGLGMISRTHLFSLMYLPLNVWNEWSLARPRYIVECYAQNASGYAIAWLYLFV